MNAGVPGAYTFRSIMPMRSRRPSETSGAGPDDIDLILATDAEQIFGIGDWGVGGIEISIGKLAIYTAAGGIDPTRVIPVMLDVGTNRRKLAGRSDVPGEPARAGPRRTLRRLHRRLCEGRREAVSECRAAMGRFRTRQRTPHPRKISRPGPHLQRRSCRAPARSRWRPRSPRCASAERCCAINASSFSAPASPASASPTCFAM